MNPVTARLFSSPAPHHNTEPPAPLLLLVITKSPVILKESRGQQPKTFHLDTRNNQMTTQNIEFNTYNDQELQACAGGGRFADVTNTVFGFISGPYAGIANKVSGAAGGPTVGGLLEKAIF